MDMKYFEFNKFYQGKNILSAITGKKLIKAGVFHSNRSEKFLTTLDQNDHYQVTDKTDQELRAWDRAIMNAKGVNTQAHDDDEPLTAETSLQESPVN